MQTIEVPVTFAGQVAVLVPDDLSDKDANLMAQRLALSRILATTDNPDAPDCEAFEDYLRDCSAEATMQADQDWDASKIQGIVGRWSLLCHEDEQ